MKERPILFSAPMIRALLAGTKTQTRRIMKPGTRGSALLGTSPYGAPGDRLWVKETIRRADKGHMSFYPADQTPTLADAWPWKRDVLTAIHCPRGLSRIDLEVTRVRVERLQEITEADAKAEGVEKEYCASPVIRERVPVREKFSDLWDEINEKRASWASNPLVWVVEFRRIRP